MYHTIFIQNDRTKDKKCVFLAKCPRVLIKPIFYRKIINCYLLGNQEILTLYLITFVNTNIYPIIYLISYWFQAPNPFPFVTLSPQTINDSGYIFQGRVSPLNNEHYQPRMSVNKSKVAS